MELRDAKGRMFRGLYEHTLDAKGRISLPSHLRDVLARQLDDRGERLIITTGIDRCLVAYPPSEWQAFEARLASLSQFDPAVVQLKRIYVAGATECQIDKHGRLLIPPLLREYAELERDLVWAGMVRTIEIWAKQHWTAQVAASRQDRQGVVRALAGLGL
jgi:MraZ protein